MTSSFSEFLIYVVLPYYALFLAKMEGHDVFFYAVFNMQNFQKKKKKNKAEEVKRKKHPQTVNIIILCRQKAGYGTISCSLLYLLECGAAHTYYCQQKKPSACCCKNMRGRQAVVFVCSSKQPRLSVNIDERRLSYLAMLRYWNPFPIGNHWLLVKVSITGQLFLVLWHFPFAPFSSVAYIKILVYYTNAC